MNQILAFGMLLASSGTDLFQEAWTEGNLYSIQGVVNVLGGISCKVISIVGFGIVIFSVFKNAMSGLYVVNPNFWDKVDDLKNSAVNGLSNTINGGAAMVGNSQMGQAFGGTGNAAAMKLGSLFTFILSAIPNIKALTDFDDGELPDKKQYFMKSIPLLIMQIFIGMLIFFGYPAKIANWIGTGATYAIQAVLNNVDPVKTVQKVADGIMIYNLSTDGTQDPIEQKVNDASREIMRVVYTTYDDIEKGPAQETALWIETALLETFSNDTVGTVLGASDGYSVTYNASFQQNEPKVSSSYKSVSTSDNCTLYMAQATNGTTSFRCWLPGPQLPSGSTKVGPSDYYVLTVTATPRALSNVSTISAVCCAGVSDLPTQDVAAGTFSVSIIGQTFGSGQKDIRGTLGKAVVVEVVSTDNGEVLHTVSANLASASVGISDNATGVLIFNKADREILKTNNSYLRVNLPGSWSYAEPDSNGKATTTYKVSELRLSTGVSDATWAVTADSTFTMKDKTGKAGTISGAVKLATPGTKDNNGDGNGGEDKDKKPSETEKAE